MVWFFLSLSFTALTVCALFAMEGQWIYEQDWAAIEDVTPATIKIAWIGTVSSILLNGIGYWMADRHNTVV